MTCFPLGSIRVKHLIGGFCIGVPRDSGSGAVHSQQQSISYREMVRWHFLARLAPKVTTFPHTHNLKLMRQRVSPSQTQTHEIRGLLLVWRKQTNFMKVIWSSFVKVPLAPVTRKENDSQILICLSVYLRNSRRERGRERDFLFNFTNACNSQPELDPTKAEVGTQLRFPVPMAGTKWSTWTIICCLLGWV